MISIGIEGSVTNISHKKLRLHIWKYECTDAGVQIRNYEPTMIYLLFNIIKPATKIGVSNLKYDIEKTTLAKFGNVVKYLLDDMY